MNNRGTILSVLRHCAKDECYGCPYRGIRSCTHRMAIDSTKTIEQLMAHTVEHDWQHDEPKTDNAQKAQADKDAVIRSINTIRKMIDMKEFEHKPSQEELRAIDLAVSIMHDCIEDLKWPIEKHYMILKYHAEKPTALIFKDKYTLAALNAALQAME